MLACKAMLQALIFVSVEANLQSKLNRVAKTLTKQPCFARMPDCKSDA